MLTFPNEVNLCRLDVLLIYSSSSSAAYLHVQLICCLSIQRICSSSVTHLLLICCSSASAASLAQGEVSVVDSSWNQVMLVDARSSVVDSSSCILVELVGLVDAR